MKVGLCDLHVVCVSMNPPSPLTFECLNQSLWNVICISWHLSPFQRCTSLIPPFSLCVICVSPLLLLGKGSIQCTLPLIARQLLGKHVPTATNIWNNRNILGHECLWVCLRILLSLLGCYLAVKMFPLQRRTVEGVVFYAVRVLSKK
jgi:hypothetical protein